jgi:hypothetical protein
MGTEPLDLESLVRAFRYDIAKFAQRNRVSIIEMTSLLGATVLDLGIRLERAGGIADRTKTYDVPLASDLLNVLAAFGERHHINPVEMLAVLGGTIVELGAEIESDVNRGKRVN